MRIRIRKNLVKKNLALTLVIFLIPGGLGGLYFAGMNYILNDMKSFSYNYVLDYDSMKLVESYTTLDYEYLHQNVSIVDYRLELYHMPLNFTVDTYFTDNEGIIDYNTPLYYGGAGDTTLWTGTTLLGQVYRFKVAKLENNLEQMQNASRIIKKLFTALELNIVVPSGGYGSKYPGVIARCVVAPENFNIYPSAINYPYNGTGPYKDWKCLMYTSRDSVAGWMMGMAAMLEVYDDPLINLRLNVTNCIEQFVEGLIQNDWMGIDGNGNPQGTNYKPIFINSGWALSVLQLARMVNPSKYNPLYYYYASRSGYLDSVRQGSDSQLIVDYYAFNFATDALYCLIMPESDNILRNKYIKIFNNGIYKPTSNHRNCYFNVIYLLFNQIRSPLIEKDILDQLRRFDVSRNPYRGFLPTNVPTEIDPTIGNWLDFFEDHPLGILYGWIGSAYKDFKTQFYTIPRTLDMWQTEHDYVWQVNPFRAYESESISYPQLESTGISLSVPYWIGRYIGIIPQPTP